MLRSNESGVKWGSRTLKQWGLCSQKACKIRLVWLMSLEYDAKNLCLFYLKEWWTHEGLTKGWQVAIVGVVNCTNIKWSRSGTITTQESINVELDFELKLRSNAIDTCIIENFLEYWSIVLEGYIHRQLI